MGNLEKVPDRMGWSPLELARRAAGRGNREDILTQFGKVARPYVPQGPKLWPTWERYRTAWTGVLLGWPKGQPVVETEKIS